MIFNSCLSGRKWQGPVLSGTWCLSCLRAMHPFTLQLRLIVVAFFYRFLKKTKRKSHWQPTNHNKKKTLNRNTQPSLKKQLEAYIHAYMQMHKRVHCLATGCGTSNNRYSISNFALNSVAIHFMLFSAHNFLNSSWTFV